MFAEVGDDKTNEEELEKQYEEETEEITLGKTLEMADNLKMYCLRKGIPDVPTRASEIVDKIMNFTTTNLKQFSLVSQFNKPVSPSQ